MNEKFPQNEREKLEEKLTALLLGELPAHEEAALHRAMDEDPELAGLYERLKLAIELVRSAECGVRLAAPKSDEGGSAELKLSAEKREKLLAHFKTVQPKEFVEETSKRVLFDNRQRIRVFEWAAVAAVALFIAAIAVPNFVRSRSTAVKNTIFNNLRLFDGAKQTLALESNLSANRVVKLDEVRPYLGRGGGVVTDDFSVAGETYVMGKVGEQPAVEMSVSKARKMFGKEVVARGEVHDGKVRLSMDNLLNEPGQIDVADQKAMAALPRELRQLAPKKGDVLGQDATVWKEAIHAGTVVAKGGEERPAAAQPLTTREMNQTATFGLNAQTAPATPKPEIFLPSSNESTLNEQFAMNNLDFRNKSENSSSSAFSFNDVAVTNGIGTNSEWLGILEPPQKFDASNSAFVARYASLATPENLSVSGFSNYAGFNDETASAGDISNLLANMGSSNDSYNPQTSYRMLSQLDSEGGRTNPAMVKFYTGLSRDDVSGLRYLPTNGVVASQAIAGNGGTTMSWNTFDGTTNAATTISGGSVPNDVDLGLAGTNSFADRMEVNGATLADNSQTAKDTEQTHGGRSFTHRVRDLFGRDRSSVETSTDQKVAEAAAEAGLQQALKELSASNGVPPVVQAPAATPEPNSMPAIVLPSMGEQSGGGGGSAGQLPRRAVGGKQVEMAAAANPEAKRERQPQMTLIPNRPPEPSGPVLTAGSNPTAAMIPESEAIIEAVKPLDKEQILTVQDVRDGIKLLDSGKLDEADAKLKEALARNPNNQAAIYYESLIKQISTNGIVAMGGSMPEQQALQIREQFQTNAQIASEKDVELAQLAPYYQAKEKLEVEKHWREVLKMKTGQEMVDEELPKARMVTIIDPATVAATEKRSFGERIRQDFSGKVESTTRITVDTEHPDISGVGGAPGASGYDPYFLQTEFNVIQSHAVLSKVVEALNLKELWGKKYNDGKPMSESDVEARIKHNLDVQPVRNTKLIEIRAFSDSPDDAVKLANQVAESYKRYRSDEYDEVKSRGIKSLQEQLDQQDEKVAEAQQKVDQLRKQLNISDENAEGTLPFFTAKTLDYLVSKKVQLQADYEQQSALLANLKSMKRGDLRNALPVAVTDSQLNTLLSELDLAQQNLLKLKGDYSENHAKYQSAKASVDQLNQKVDERIDGILVGLQTQVESSKAALDSLNAQLESTKTNAAVVPQQSDTALPKPAVPPPTPQPEILTSSNAFSTFSMNVSDVSFKLAAASLEKGQMPEPASIRSEEFINAFDYRDPEAAPGVPVAFNYERALYPFAHNRELLRFSLKTAAAGRQAGRPLNIVVLLDNSGSMERADRVEIIQQALRVLAGQLQAQDTFSIVTFARTARLRVDGIPGNQAAAAAEEVSKFTPEGGTDLGSALDVAYETAVHHYLANGDNRVVLLTDGAANLGDVDSNSLKQKVDAHRKQGIALDCFGIGWEGYNDDLLEVLTRDGDGRYGFINTPEEASTEFVSQIAGTLHVAAADVKVQVEFNPDRVISYRQIGYAKHQLTKEQFRDNTVAAGQIAAQEAGNALYTIEINPQGQGSIGTVRVRYKVPDTGEIREQSWDVPYTGAAMPLEQASPAMRLAATASAFSEWLATSPFAEEVTTDQLLNYLNGVPQVYGADTRPQKLEWMIRQARSISGK